MKLEFSGQIFEKYWNIKFHKSASSGSWIVPAGGRTDGRRDTTKLRVAFRNFATTPKFAALLVDALHAILIV